MKQRRTITALGAAVAALMLVCPGASAGRNKGGTGPELTEQGQKLRAKYEQMLTSAQADITAALPEIEESRKSALLAARSALQAVTEPEPGATSADMAKYREAKSQAESKLAQIARALLADLDTFLADDNIDGKLMRAAILVHGTPGGLAAFAQQGQEEEGLLDTLFADEELMKQILEAGGAAGGEYGKAMRIYTAMLQASERARERGSIFQRLALGTSIEMEVAIRGREVERYQHYEKAYLDGELDPAFKDMTTWECRMITNGSRSNEDLAWFREMLRTYRPDHIRNPDYKWRYTRIVKSDMPYCSIRHDPSLGTGSQQALALGGSCGPRAWFGRLAARAFGIPSRKHPQVAHGAMSHWTPTGWVVNFGAWWSYSPGGLDFFLDSQAREFPDAYMQVLRAQWIGNALGEEKVDNIRYGNGGGFWNQLAFGKKEVIVEDARIEKSEEEKLLAAMSADEAKTLLGESDAMLIDTEESPGLEIPEEYRMIAVAEDGSITIPAAACVQPTSNTPKIAFMESWGGGWQVHYQRLGGRPQLLKYELELPADGSYTLTAHVATVAAWQKSLFRINRRTLVEMKLPYTKGYWQETEPVTVDLRAGRNTLLFTCPEGNRGVSLKSVTLKPVGMNLGGL